MFGGGVPAGDDEGHAVWSSWYKDQAAKENNHKSLVSVMADIERDCTGAVGGPVMTKPSP
jgi:hypothetical protein